MSPEKKKSYRVLLSEGEGEIVEKKDIVASVDPDAFVIVSDVREVLGEGFLEYHTN